MKVGDIVTLSKAGQHLENARDDDVWIGKLVQINENSQYQWRVRWFVITSQGAIVKDGPIPARYLRRDLKHFLTASERRQCQSSK
tara:strand:+ start:936 stop:1190 length:255 start_codon:yes stop_codon:yes gene_type:complete